MPFAAQCEAGNVLIVRAPWNANYLDELCMFPEYAFCDQVDAASACYQKLAKVAPDGLFSQRLTKEVSTEHYGELARTSAKHTSIWSLTVEQPKLRRYMRADDVQGVGLLVFRGGRDAHSIAWADGEQQYAIPEWLGELGITELDEPEQIESVEIVPPPVPNSESIPPAEQIEPVDPVAEVEATEPVVLPARKL